MEILDYLAKTFSDLGKSPFKIRTHIVCKDGFSMSVQASERHACEPREDLESGLYNSVEIGLTTERVDILEPYVITENEDAYENVYYCVPIELVESIIKSHGGIRN